MQFSIIVPTFKNYKYLKSSINSIKKNSSYEHQVIVHLNGKDDETEKYLKAQNILFTKTEENIGLCSGVNIAARMSTHDFIVYAHDDMYFCPKWDYFLVDEIKSLLDKNFYLSSTQISPIGQLKSTKMNHIYYDCGDSLDNFNEQKLIDNYAKLEFYDLQGSHWAPHIMPRKLWDEVGGFSEEYDPGFGSDPDLNMKLWSRGVRIFKCVNNSRVYHFGSQTTRKNKKVIRNNANKTFLLKWGISIDFFVKYYLKRGDKFINPLKNFKLSFLNFFPFLICKIKFFFLNLKKN